MPGDVTTALYWTDRPYTLYIWQVHGTKEAVYYFNIADSITLLPDEFSWRDLTVDIFIDTAGAVHVLDEDELPVDLTAELQCYILTAKSHILNCYRDLIIEANVLVKKYVVTAISKL
jgi:predicted RNA-binding protein associated with RNAse of E/G family